MGKLDGKLAIITGAASGMHECDAFDAPDSTVVRKNSTTVMQRGPRGRTRGEVHSVRSAPQLGLVG